MTFRDEVERFTLTKEHIALLRAANVSWHHTEWGAPCVDGKRPYGNGDLYDDIASLIGMAVKCDNCDHNVLGDNDRARIKALHGPCTKIPAKRPVVVQDAILHENRDRHRVRGSLR